MQAINWNIFNIKNANKEDAFQNMCKHLFCREFSISGYDLQANYNNPGLEAHPVLQGDKYYGFQCKYIETSSDSTIYREVNDSLDKAYETYKGKLDFIYIYSNANIKPEVSDKELSDLTKKSMRIKIQRSANKRGAVIKWITKDSLELMLNDPKNNDIAMFYFSESRELDFLNSSISIQDKTFLNSDEFISLPIRDYDSYENIINLLEKKICAMVLGNAGSGKTLMMKKIFSHYKDKFISEYSNAIIGTPIFPVFIRLRECINGNLEDIVRQRLRDYRVDKTVNAFKYLYFFDGFDEVSSIYVDNVLNYTKCLKNDPNIHGIVFSSRKDSFNLTFLYRCFSELNKIEILPLNNKHIQCFFESKKDARKTQKMQEIELKNHSLISDLDDIFSVSLFWDVIENVDEATTKIDLCEQSVNYFLNNYIKYTEINLPESKAQYIKELFCDIAYHMRMSNLLNISLADLQLLIQARFDRLSYDHINRIVYSFSELFFEKADHKDQTIFSFRHRRFQEYFLCKKIVEIFPKRPSVLRELQLLNDKDFILKIFLKYAIKESISRKDVLMNLSLRFFEAYLGSDYWAGYEDELIGRRSDYGVGSADPLEQNEFINALASQTKENLLILFDNFGIKKNNLSSTKVLSKLIILFHKKNNLNVWDEIIEHFTYLGDELNLEEFNSIYDQMYFCNFINDKDTYSEVYIDYIKDLEVNPNTDFMSNADGTCTDVLSFYEYLLDYKIPFLCKIIDNMNIEHLELLCYQLLRNEYVYLVASNDAEVNDLKNSITERIESHSEDAFLLNTIVFYNLVTRKDYGVETLKIRFGKVNQNNLPTWDRNIEANQYIAILFEKDATIYTPNYKLGVEIKKIAISNNSLEKILHEIVSAVQQYNFSTYNWFRFSNSILIGAILSTFPFALDDIKKAIRSLLNYDSVINILTIFYCIFNTNLNLFKQIANESILNLIYEKSTKQLSYYDDNSNVDYMFASMYSVFNTDKSHQLILKGMNNSICRPSFRKEDTIKYVLPNCLELFAINNWYSEDQLKIFAVRIYDMLKIMSETTDRGSDLLYFKRVLLEFIPSSTILNEREIYDIKTENATEEIISSKISVKTLQISDVTIASLNNYYECKVDGVDYGSIETWDCLINFELNNDVNLAQLFATLKNNHFPEPHWSRVNEYFPLITAILLKNTKTKLRTVDFILSQGGRSGIVNILKASILNSDILNGKRYFEELLLLCEMIVYPMNTISSEDEKSIDLISDAISAVENSTKEDWHINVNDERIFRLNPNIKIVSNNFEERTPFHEEWAISNPDRNAYSNEYSVYYNSNLIKKYYLVSVDGGRAILPIPRWGTNIISRKDYRFALIINQSEMLDYVHRSGLIVE